MLRTSTSDAPKMSPLNSPDALNGAFAPRIGCWVLGFRVWGVGKFTTDRAGRRALRLIYGAHLCGKPLQRAHLHVRSHKVTRLVR